MYLPACEILAVADERGLSGTEKTLFGCSASQQAKNRVLCMSHVETLGKVTTYGRDAAVLVFVFLIRGYQAIVRPLLAGSCKYCPTCSEYAIEALQTHGLWRGVLLSAQRLCRCHPFTRGGIDPVPPTIASRRPNAAD